MPKGFLVKRTKRTGGSYRVRLPERGFPLPGPLVAPPGPDVSLLCAERAASPTQEETAKELRSEAAQELSGLPCRAVGVSLAAGGREGVEWSANGREGPGPSPAKPAGAELRRAFLERCLRSPVSAESFPGGAAALATFSCSVAPVAAPTSGEQFLLPLRAPFPEPALQLDPAPLSAALHGLKRPVGSERRAKGPAGGSPGPAAPTAAGIKKPKAMRKLSFADEVTTSPVLGLKIKEEEPGAPSRAQAGSRTPLGEFICQLCKEQYADPFALAQHRCSRIVRVEYRCPECDKVFSCPANLASHRRWHKPRPVTATSASADGKPPPSSSASCADSGHLAPFLAEGKENSRAERTADQHPKAEDSSGDSQHQDSDSAPRQGFQVLAHPEPQVLQAPYTEGVLGHRVPGPSSGAGCSEIFVCPYCHKKFRRQAYLRKHLGTHEAGSARALLPSFGSERGPPLAFACPLCGAHFPSADIREKHRLWHAVREELLLPALSGAPPEAPGPGGAAEGGAQQIFSCKHCSSTFFSSPGLTRHINKCHPSESRQVLLLQMPLRPGC
ncbi:insulinoma-associated protein 2 [Thomomys bottae]